MLTLSVWEEEHKAVRAPDSQLGENIQMIYTTSKQTQQ